MRKGAISDLAVTSPGNSSKGSNSFSKGWSDSAGAERRVELQQAMFATSAVSRALLIPRPPSLKGRTACCHSATNYSAQGGPEGVVKFCNCSPMASLGTVLSRWLTLPTPKQLRNRCMGHLSPEVCSVVQLLYR